MKGEGVLLAAFAVAACLLSSCVRPPVPVDGAAVELRATEDVAGQICVAVVRDERIPLADLERVARRWRGQEVVVGGDINTPWRCVGGIINALQRAGVERVGFISAPPEQ